ncbi:HupE/UreJ family protein [Photobacterium toruni]|uniref:HupE/UreJ family protein n=1 Tax=Photobacterium toruni TaxID=1935446 RepID=A0ABU6L4Y8_9GAMM|nr:HupE/UreJ family protein [Photobacterium toruni]
MTLSLVWSPQVVAHPYQPAVGLINQINNHHYELTLKLPVVAGEHTIITPILSGGGKIKLLSSQDSLDGFGMDLHRYLLIFPTTNTAPLIRFQGLNNIQLLTQVTNQHGKINTLVLYKGHSHLLLAGKVSTWSTIKLFVTLGITHILTGIDHLMFVAGLLLFTRDFRTFLKAITCFTLAHSITLSLSALNLIHIPEPPVEAGIALSILFLCYELTRPNNKDQPTLSRRFPWLISFSFGLLHGLGFASALKAAGLQQTSIPLALACFNVGVEIGQLIFLSLLLTILKICSKIAFFQKSIFRQLPLYIMGIMASFWFIQRVYIVFH